ncbi:MAG: protein translocase subunit SecF, partial [Sphingomonadales bacterium]|nr:protein translocase subunit SecF [Sphingomonadales bacterium]
AVHLAPLRSGLNTLGLGDVAIQNFGSPQEVLIRIQRQAGEADAQAAAVEKVKAKVSEIIPGEVSYRRVEFVGPKVSGELVQVGVEAVLISLAAILVYIWFRFEWQFGLAAVITTFHDVMMTIGVFSLTGMQFDLTIIAALLAIVGYSLNDTVVVFDRIRENLRKYRKMDLRELIDLTINETLSRTTMTSFTTLLAVLALFIFGGEVIHGFAAAMIWGILLGTYSSIFVAAPLLPWLKVRRDFGEVTEAKAKP